MRFARKRSFGRFWVYLFLVLVSIFCLFPFYFMLAGSLMRQGEIFSLKPHFWPENFVYQNYIDLFNSLNFTANLRNSAFVSVSQTLGVLFFSSLAGFIFAKRRFPGRDGLFIFILITTTLPGGYTTIIPFYLMMVQIGWINTFWPLIIPWWAPPLAIFLMRQYISAGVPDELIEAARIDGCGLFQTYWRIVLPLCTPGLVVIGINQFIAVWNDFLYGLLMLQKAELRTVTVALAEISQRPSQAIPYGALFAGIVLATLPTIIIYFIFQRRLTSGILEGSLKG
jgi:cellobiose transport system permease protein